MHTLRLYMKYMHQKKACDHEQAFAIKINLKKVQKASGFIFNLKKISNSLI